MKALFQLGEIVATANALERLTEEDIHNAIKRHSNGDWGVLDTHDWQQNMRSLKEGDRLLSVYNSGSGTRFWIITEADRSVTTVLLPEDY